jgi:hypothetical protein
MNHREPTIKLILRSIPQMRIAAGLSGPAPEEYDRASARLMLELIRDEREKALAAIAKRPELAELLVSHIEDAFRRWETTGGTSEAARRERERVRRFYLEVEAVAPTLNQRIEVDRELDEALAPLTARLLGIDGVLELADAEDEETEEC